MQKLRFVRRLSGECDVIGVRGLMQEISQVACRHVEVPSFMHVIHVEQECVGDDRTGVRGLGPRVSGLEFWGRCAFSECVGQDAGHVRGLTSERLRVPLITNCGKQCASGCLAHLPLPFMHAWYSRSCAFPLSPRDCDPV